MEIVIIGSGNVATHLSKALLSAGNKIKQVYSRTEIAAKKLGQELDADYTSYIQSIDNEADLYVFSVSDNVIPELAKRVNITNKNVVHTAGSVPLSVFKNARNHGVFYPLQTFSKSREVSFKEIPLCIEANTTEFNDTLIALAHKISNSVWQIDSIQRKQLHLSAVFACNFVNHLYALSKELINDRDIDFKILHPLIKETAIKATMMDPKLSQTGPAVRNDTESLKKHIELLSSYPEIQGLYRHLSESIRLFNS